MNWRRQSLLTASNPMTLTLLGASKVTVGKLAYRLSAPLHKTGSWVVNAASKVRFLTVHK